MSRQWPQFSGLFGRLLSGVILCFGCHTGIAEVLYVTPQSAESDLIRLVEFDTGVSRFEQYRDSRRSKVFIVESSGEQGAELLERGLKLVEGGETELFSELNYRYTDAEFSLRALAGFGAAGGFGLGIKEGLRTGSLGITVLAAIGGSALGALVGIGTHLLWKPSVVGLMPGEVERIRAKANELGGVPIILPKTNERVVATRGAFKEAGFSGVCRYSRLK